MGSMGGAGAFGAVGGLGGGGFTYGQASQGGSIPFGAASAAGPIGSGIGGIGSKPATNTFGANSASLGGPGAFSFGGASQFGGIGGGTSSIFNPGQASSTAAPASDDPYANIDIDFTKVKQAKKPAKAFEEKTEEEKVKDAEKRNISVKSNLKTTTSDFENAAAKGKKEVRFGKSTTY